MNYFKCPWCGKVYMFESDNKRYFNIYCSREMRAVRALRMTDAEVEEYKNVR